MEVLTAITYILRQNITNCPVQSLFLSAALGAVASHVLRLHTRITSTKYAQASHMCTPTYLVLPDMRRGARSRDTYQYADTNLSGMSEVESLSTVHRSGDTMQWLNWS